MAQTVLGPRRQSGEASAAASGAKVQVSNREDGAAAREVRMFYFCISGFEDRLLDFSFHSSWGYSCTWNVGCPLAKESKTRDNKGHSRRGVTASQTLPQQPPMDYLKPCVLDTALGPRALKMG